MHFQVLFITTEAEKGTASRSEFDAWSLELDAWSLEFNVEFDARSTEFHAWSLVFDAPSSEFLMLR